MKRCLFFGLVLGILECGSLLLLSNVWAEELSVPSQYGTIRVAIDAATNGDTVVVNDGT